MRRLFNLRIYKKSRIEKIVQMIAGTQGDRDLAISLLVGPNTKKSSKYPKFRIRVGYKSMCAEIQHKGENWIQIGYTSTFNNESSKKASLEYCEKTIADRRKQEEALTIEKEFKEYTIDY